MLEMNALPKDLILKKIFGESHFIIFQQDQSLTTLTLIAILIGFMFLFTLILTGLRLLVQKFSKILTFVDKIINLLRWSIVIKTV
jgi:hypothetical protein